uniref:NTF2-like domain-containing protein n=1 Tax=Caenorhabditis japonica TaxID=281687 RepID=A0A8R1I7G5_CAEJA
MRYLKLLVFSSILFGALHADFFPSYATPDPIAVVSSFLTKLVRTIEKVDKIQLGVLFHDGFAFEGCSRNLGKSQLIELLTTLRPGTQFSFTPIKASYIAPHTIQYRVAIQGIASTNYFEADFVLNVHNGNFILVSGKRPECPRNPIGTAREGSDATVNKFLGIMESVIGSGNVAHFGMFFEDGFLFNGCKGNYGKQQVLGLLSKLPKGARPVFRLVWSRYIGDNSIEYQVISRGVGQKEVTAIFNLRVLNNTWILHSGRMAQCQ